MSNTTPQVQNVRVLDNASLSDLIRAFNTFQTRLAAALNGPVLSLGATRLWGAEVPDPIEQNDGQAIVWSQSQRAWLLASSGQPPTMFRAGSFTAKTCGQYNISAAAGNVTATLPDLRGLPAGATVVLVKVDSTGHTITPVGVAGQKVNPMFPSAPSLASPGDSMTLRGRNVTSQGDLNWVVIG